MAATILKRSAVIWVPPRSVGERALASEASLLVAQPGVEGEAPRSSRASLDALQLRAAVLLFDARDVTLLPVALPPLTGTRLARALPNLVEDSLLQDAQSCAFALGPRLGDGRRLVAVIDRGWFEFVVGAFERRGVRITAAWPAQLALPLPADGWSMACVHGGVSVRTGETEGFGWTAAAGEAEARAEAIAAVLDVAAHVAGRAEGVDVFAEDPAWALAIDLAARRTGLALRMQPLPAPRPAPVDLLSARQGSPGSRWLAGIDWRAWRLPGALAAACVVAFLAGLNLHWAQLAGERAELRAQMERAFREAFPSAQVVVDPLLQMQRQVAELRLSTGQSGPDDFLPMLSRFSEALGPRAVDGVASMEYREGRLKVRLREGLLDGPSAIDALRAACRQRGLKLEPDPQQASTVLVGPLT